MSNQKLLEEALAPSPKERGELAAALLQSLGPEDEDALTHAERAEAWTAEVDRRLRDLHEARATAISSEELQPRVRPPSPQR
jgi:putative addiction module component (TIGR02574 family)